MWVIDGYSLPIVDTYATMADRVSRKDAFATMGEAVGWLKRNPVLVALFFLLGIVDSLGQEIPLIGLVSLLLFLYFGGIAHLFARDEIRGTHPDLGAASSRVLGRLLSLIGIFIVYAIAVTVGLLLLIIPGIYLALRLSLAFPACVIDDQGAFESLSTSWDVAHGNLLKLLGITIIAFFVMLLALILAVPFAESGAGLLVVYVLLVAVISAAVQPTVEMAYARVYLENRGSDPATGPRSDDPWNEDDSWDEDGDDDPWNEDKRNW